MENVLEITLDSNRKAKEWEFFEEYLNLGVGTLVMPDTCTLNELKYEINSQLEFYKDETEDDYDPKFKDVKVIIVKKAIFIKNALVDFQG